MTNVANITEKNYNKLVLQVALNELTFCCIDHLTQNITALIHIPFDDIKKNLKTEDFLKDAFEKHPELSQPFDEVIVIHSNTLATLVPEPLFDIDYLGSYLQYNTKVFDTDFFAFDTLDNYQINTVYIPYININNFLIDRFGSFEYKHSSSILVTKMLDMSKNKDEKKMIAHLGSNHFELMVVQNQKLLFFNAFEYNTPEDFIYYILFTAEQLDLNPEYVVLELLGTISKDSDLFKIAYKFIRNVQLLAVKNAQKNDSLTEQQWRQHFILLHS